LPSATARVPLIHLRGVSKAYRSDAETVWAARDVDFTAYPGEFVCVHGASGSGKSTLLNLLAGLDLADEGEIQVGGVDVCASDEKDRAKLRLVTVGVVFQEHQLIDEFTAVENVALPLEARGLNRREARSEALNQLSRVGLAGLEDRFPSELSGGQRQRVGVARALTGERAILLGDEPTGSLDSGSTVALFELVRAFCDAGTLAVIASHDPRCRDFADTVYEVVDGRLSLRSSPAVTA